MRPAKIAAAFVLVAMWPSWAQTKTPLATSVAIVVSDQSGAKVPEVNVRLIPPPEMFRTGSAGTILAALKPGEYELVVTASGFKTTDKFFEVGASAQQTLPVTLLVGATASGFPVASEAHLEVVVPPQDRHSIYISEFDALPKKTVTFHNAHTNTDETYSGVPLSDLLAKFGAPTGEKLHGKPLSDYIVATGSDGYKAVLALAETDPSFHPGGVIVADSMDGKPIGDKDGPFRLIVTEDKRPARCVHNLVSIELKSAD